MVQVRSIRTVTERMFKHWVTQDSWKQKDGTEIIKSIPSETPRLSYKLIEKLYIEL